MAKIVVLGGAGVVGSACVKMLAKSKQFSEIVIGDFDLKAAQHLAVDLGKGVSAAKVDANHPETLCPIISDAEIVINCVGPYYKYLQPILSTVIAMKKNYVDVCDDTGATYEALGMDGAAKSAGITAIIGCGSSPGITNLLAKYAATELLEQCESIEMYHIHGGEPAEGPGVIGHRFYCLSVPVPVFLDGKAIQMSQQESVSLEEDVTFINLPGKHHVYPYPHPEPITLPMWISGLKKVTNKGSVLPEEYYRLTRQIHACGLDSKEPIHVKDQVIVPYDFAIAYLITKRDKILKATHFGEQRGCVKIVVKGKKKGTGEIRTYVFSLVSEGAGKGQALGEATGIPCALAAILMHQKRILVKGVVPPEGAIEVMDFLQLMKEIMDVDKTGKDESKRSPIIFESIDEHGKVKKMEF